MTSLADLARKARAQGLIAAPTTPAWRGVPALGPIVDLDHLTGQTLNAVVRDRTGDVWQLERTASGIRWVVIEYRGDNLEHSEYRARCDDSMLLEYYAPLYLLREGGHGHDQPR